MQMRVEIHGTSRSLYEGDRPTATALGPGLASIPTLYDTEEHGEHGAEQGPIPGQAVADLERKAEYPLTHGYQRQYFLGQPRCGVGHAAAHAAGTEAPLLAGERDDPTLAAVFASYSKKPVGENAALQVGAHLLFDVPRELAIGGLQLRQEGFQVAGHGPVQGLGFGRAATIGNGGHAAPVCKSQAVCTSGRAGA